MGKLSGGEEKPLKVVVKVTVTLSNPSQWTMAFGIERRSDIKQDVKQYIGEEIVKSGGVFGNGEVDAEITWE